MPITGQGTTESIGAVPITRTLTHTQPAAGITVTPSTAQDLSANRAWTYALANDLLALEGLSSTGIAVRTASDTWAQRSVTGTSDRIDITNGSGVSGNPTVDIASTYVGQTSITTLGTVTSGTWNGTTIAVANGGTGVTSLSDVLGTTNQVNVLGGTARVIGGNVTLSLPQNIHTAATPTFANLTLSNRTATQLAFYTTGGAFSGSSDAIYEAGPRRINLTNGQFIISGGANGVIRGLITEVSFTNADLITEFGLNASQLGARVNGSDGVLFRLDTRNSRAGTNVPFFSVIYQKWNGSSFNAELFAFQIGTDNNVAFGRAESATHRAKIDVVNTTAAQPILRLGGHASQSGNVLEYRTSADVLNLSVATDGSLTSVRDVRGRQLIADGDNAGTASTNTLTNGTDSVGESVTALLQRLGNEGSSHVGYIKMYVGTSAVYVPYFN